MDSLGLSLVASQMKRKLKSINIYILFRIHIQAPLTSFRPNTIIARPIIVTLTKSAHDIQKHKNKILTLCLRPRHLLQAKLVCFLLILGVGGFGSMVAGSTIMFRQHHSPDLVSS